MLLSTQQKHNGTHFMPTETSANLKLLNYEINIRKKERMTLTVIFSSLTDALNNLNIINDFRKKLKIVFFNKPCKL